MICYNRDGVPCRHEYAVGKRFGLQHMIRDIAEFNETANIRAAMGEDFDMPNLGNLEEKNIALPQINVHPGRPKTLRGRGCNEFYFKGTPRKCSICGKVGHDRRKCKETDKEKEELDVMPINLIKAMDLSIEKQQQEEIERSQRRKTEARHD